MKKSFYEDLAFEDSISEDWTDDPEVVEMRLDQRPTRLITIFLVALVAIITGRVLYLNVIRGNFYTARAEANVNRIEHILAPRGIIEDRNGKVLAENRSVFRAVLKLDEFFKNPDLEDETLHTIQSILGIDPEKVKEQIAEANREGTSEPIVLGEDITQEQVVKMKALNLPTIGVGDAFMRHYSDGHAFSSLIGYVSLPSAKDLSSRPSLSSQDLVGKAGLEAYYDESLQGTPGVFVKVRNARGKIVHEEERSIPKIGNTLKLTIDSEFQQYFYERMSAGLKALNRTSGAAIAMDPRSGEILALMSFPSYDANIFSSPGNSDKKREILNSPLKPLFDRAVGGNYSPGSTVKPLDSVALLKEKIIDPKRTIYSPGYLDVPNPYNPSNPSRYLDWRPQGDVDIYHAIAFSSDVYYYVTVGGFYDIKGLGITRLKEWWQRFGFGAPTGVDLPGEAKGFLPDPEWKKSKQGKDWLLGDTFNVAIGQGDLQVTPIQLINYISAIANGGTLWKPSVTLDNAKKEKLADLTYLAPEIREVQKGMRQTVTHARGTAHALDSLPFPIYAKTGTAQIQNNTKENSFFMGYAGDDARVAILILVEDAVIGGTNTLPTAKDVLNWYYEHRMK